ncbi:hypothetical protein D3C77_391680 [compost metagenome]
MQHAMATTHVDQREQGNQGTKQAEHAFTDQCRQQLLASQPSVEQATKLPGTVVEERQHNALQGFVTAWSGLMAINDLTGTAVFKEPQRVVGAVQVRRQFAVVRRAQAQQPVARGVARLAQQQVNMLIVSGIAVVEVAALVQLHQRFKGTAIRRLAETVDDDIAMCVDPGQALQGRHPFL